MSERKPKLDLDALEKVARAVPVVPWETTDDQCVREPNWGVIVADFSCHGRGEWENYATYHRSFDPPTVLALLDAARAEGGAASPGQMLQAIHAAHFNGGGWVDPLEWSDFDEEGQAKWEEFAKTIAGNIKGAVEGAASGLAAGSHQPVVQQPRAEHNSPETGDVEGLAKEIAEALFQQTEELFYAPSDPDAVRCAEIAAAVLSRLLQEARGEALRAWQTARAEALDEALDRAETAERLLGEVVGALEPFAKIADHLTPGAYGPAWGFNGGVIEHEDFRRAREALSKVSEEGFSASQGSVEGPGCVPAANRSHQPSAEGAVSPEGK